MNSRLEKLFETYKFSQKDRYDFLQIYNLLPDYKKVNAIENFGFIAERIVLLKEELAAQQEILFGKTLENIEERLKKNKKNALRAHSREEIQSLKNML